LAIISVEPDIRFASLRRTIELDHALTRCREVLSDVSTSNDLRPHPFGHGSRSNSSGPDNLALKLRRCRHRVEDGAVFADIVMQEIETAVIFVRIDDQLIGN